MNAPPTRPPYLFYSPKCPFCTQLIQLIQTNQALARTIEPINIHTARSLPPQLDGVPAILFKNQLLVGPDTFKWVQFQPKPQQRKNDEEDRPGMNGGPGMMRQEQDDMPGIPLPSDISSDTKHGIDFTPLPGQENTKVDPTIPRFAFLPGQHSQTSGTDGIDIAAAMDVASSTKDRSNGMAQQYEQLQKLRSMDNERLSEQSGGGGYNYARQAPPTTGDYEQYGGGGGGGRNGQSGQGGGYNQGGGGGGGGNYGGGSGGFGQGGGQGQGGQGGGGNPYELPTGQRGGYGSMYQQQNSQYQGDMPNRY